MATFIYLWWLYVILAFLTPPGNTKSLCQGTGCTCDDSGSFFRIQCSHRGITTIPIYQNARTLRKGRRVYVNFNGNSIQRVLDNAFLSWTGMHVSDINIVLGNNNIFSIEDGAFNGMEDVITNLDLSNNKLTTLPDALVLLENLQSLKVSRNPMTKLSIPVLKGIGHSLDFFQFSYDHFSSWPLGTRYFSVLQGLDVYSDIAISVPEHAFHPDAFNGSGRSYIYLQHVDYITSAICNTPGLSQLSITITTIDHPVPHCTHHIHLKNLLIFNGFSRFPNILIAFPSLTSLTLMQNPKLNFIPDDMIPDNCSLVTINLGQNNFAAVPEALEKCNHLRVINLSFNKIRNIDICHFNNLPDVQYLNLGGNPLIYISPIAFSNLKSLSSLDLSDTNIKNIHVLSQITTLQSLDLPPSLDCTCANLGWLNTTVRQHITIYDHRSSVCSENTAVTVQTYMDTSLRACP